MAYRYFKRYFIASPSGAVQRKKDNYINRLFHDDVRQLVFRPGLTENELLRFMEILRTDFMDPRFLEDDIVTLE